MEWSTSRRRTGRRQPAKQHRRIATLDQTPQCGRWPVAGRDRVDAAIGRAGRVSGQVDTAQLRGAIAGLDQLDPAVCFRFFASPGLLLRGRVV